MVQTTSMYLCGQATAEPKQLVVSALEATCSGLKAVVLVMTTGCSIAFGGLRTQCIQTGPVLNTITALMVFLLPAIPALRLHRAAKHLTQTMLLTLAGHGTAGRIATRLTPSRLLATVAINIVLMDMVLAR